MKATILLCLCAVLSAGAQELEETLETDDRGLDEGQSLCEELEYFRENPIAIRSASFADLSSLPFLSPTIARKILDLRDGQGIGQWSDLLQIPECDEHLIRKLSRYAVVAAPGREDAYRSFRWSALHAQFRSRVASTSAGVAPSVLTRLKIVYESIDAGITQTHVPSRGNLWTGSGYMRWSAGTDLPSLVIGDFVVHEGQGLVFAGSSRSDRTGLPDQIRRKGISVSPRLSATDPLIQRGVALREEYRFLRLMLFRSLRYEGGHGEVCLHGVTAGVAAIRPLDGVDPGSMGGHMEVSAASFDMFAEIAGTSLTQPDGVAGFLYAPASAIEIAGHLRRLSSVAGNSMTHTYRASGNSGQREDGKTLGCAVRPFSGLRIALTADEFQTEREASFMSTGHDYFARADIGVGREKRITLLVRNRRTTNSSSEGRVQTNYRATISAVLQHPLEFSQRIEYTTVAPGAPSKTENGLLLLSDLSYTDRASGVSIKGRMIVFHTGGYESRLYEYEDNVQGASSTPPLYGRGIRWYVLAEAAVWGRVRISARYAETFQWNAGNAENEAGGQKPDRQVTFQLDALL